MNSSTILSSAPAPQSARTNNTDYAHAQQTAPRLEARSVEIARR